MATVMATSDRFRRVRRPPKPDRRRALELLDGCGTEGCTEGIMRANGFSIGDMVELVRAGQASATKE